MRRARKIPASLSPFSVLILVSLSSQLSLPTSHFLHISIRFAFCTLPKHKTSIWFPIALCFQPPMPSPSLHTPPSKKVRMNLGLNRIVYFSTPDIILHSNRWRTNASESLQVNSFNCRWSESDFQNNSGRRLPCRPARRMSDQAWATGSRSSASEQVPPIGPTPTFGQLTDFLTNVIKNAINYIIQDRINLVFKNVVCGLSHGHDQQLFLKVSKTSMLQRVTQLLTTLYAEIHYRE